MNFSLENIKLYLIGLLEVILLITFFTQSKVSKTTPMRYYFNRLVILLVMLLLYAYGLQLVIERGYALDYLQWLSASFGILWFYIGVILRHTESTWFLGIRNAHTLSSKENWQATHLRAASMLQAIGLLTLLGVVYKEYAIWFIVLPVCLAIYFVVGALLHLKKEMREE